MFTLDTNIARALAEKPALREILPAFHPAFARLNHPVLGKVLPRLVNVRDAARVAGVEPEALLAVMNLPGAPHPGAPLPASGSAATPRATRPAPPWLVNPVLLDVRPDIEAGAEPFAKIMAALRGLGPDQALTVVAPFEPAPLVTLLEGRGWLTHVTWEGERCLASFRPSPEATEGDSARRPVVRDVAGATGATLDVRGLEPPEPMRQVLAALDDPANRPLRVLHHREPSFLYPRLQERGLTWTVRAVDDGVEIRIDGP